MATVAKQTIESDEPSIDDSRWADRLYFTPDELQELFDSEARRIMGMSGEEFIKRWDAGEFNDIFDQPGHLQMTHLVMLIPVVRQNPS